MSDSISAEVMNLAQHYARYFIEDTTYSVVSQLSGSYPVNQDQIKAYIAKETHMRFKDEANLNINDVNVCTRFLYECAKHVLESGVADPDSREAWAMVKDLPSIHHTELGAMIYTQANLYKTTIDRTLLGVVANDAHTACEAITGAAEARSNYVETGGSVQTFSWGILSDGLWLNGAMLKAFDLASIFHPDEQVVNFYIDVAFKKAHEYAAMSLLDQADEAAAIGELSVLLANSSDPKLAHLVNEFGLTNLNDLLFAPGVLDRFVVAWENAMVSADKIVSTVQQMSLAASILQSLVDLARDDSAHETMSMDVKNRLHTTNDVVTLALVGYEALRETRYADALILNVAGDGQDPKVDVVVNSDQMHGFRMSGGEESDLVHFGLYLDPRRGSVPVSNTGWTLQHILSRRDEVVPQMMAENQDRLERLRNNDSSAIISSAQMIINKLVSSYMEASKVDTLDSVTYQRINDVIRDVVNPQATQSLDMAIAEVLLMVLNDPFLTQTFTTLMDNLKSEVPGYKENAKVMTVASASINDLMDLILSNAKA